VVLALVCLSISTVTVWSAMNRTALVSRARALELNRAQANLALAHRALDLCLNSAESWYPRDPGGAPPDGAMLKTALAFYEQIASQNSAPEVAVQTVSAYGRVGDIRAALGDIRGAEDAYRKAMRIMVDVLDRDSGDDRNCLALADVLEKFGNLMRRQAVYVPGEWFLAEAVRLFEQVARRNSGDPHIHLALARALNQMASLNGETGRTAPALAQGRRALSLLQALRSAESKPAIDTLILEKDLASIYSTLGKWLQLDGKFTEAEDAYHQALELLQHVQAEAPGKPAARESLALCQAMLGELLRATQRGPAAEPLLKQAMGGLERLVADYPGVPRYKEQLARLNVVLSTLYWSTGRIHESSAARRRALAYDPRLQRGQQVRLNNLAWYLLTAPNPAVRNPVRALELASKAVNLIPDCWESWNTLGVACYRNGNWEEAREAFLTAIDKHSGDNAFDGFFLGMVMWQLGDKQASRDWLSRAETWRLQNLPDDCELLRFRAEAEALVGPSAGFLTESPPAFPATVAEALKDPTFALPSPISEDARLESQRTPMGHGTTDGHRSAATGALRVFDVLDHALFFLDLT
jgi:tetratricopeptide (TPR) repeat protein